jgi:hypothetical protein
MARYKPEHINIGMAKATDAALVIRKMVVAKPLKTSKSPSRK